jgi:hypothetical protein
MVRPFHADKADRGHWFLVAAWKKSSFQIIELVHDPVHFEEQLLLRHLPFVQLSLGGMCIPALIVQSCDHLALHHGLQMRRLGAFAHLRELPQERCLVHVSIRKRAAVCFVPKAGAAAFSPLNDPELWRRGDVSLDMERVQLLDLVARAREAATECEDLIAALRKKLKSLKADGEEAALAQSILATLESEYDRVLMEMNRFLNELDKIAPT